MRIVKRVPKDTITVHNSAEVLAVEVGVLTAIVPPGTLRLHSTVTTTPVIVSVMCGELPTIMTVTSC